MKTILFAGPAGSGKSHTLRLLQQIAHRKALFFEETATELLSKPDNEICRDKKEFQEAIARLQFEQLNKCKNSDADVCIIDRGLPDFYVYDPENADQYLGSLENAFSFYDFVFYFREVPLRLISQGNDFRKEKSLEEMQDIVRKTKLIYELHPEPWKVFTIPVFTTPEKKCLHVAKLINEVLDMTVFSIPNVSFVNGKFVL